MEPAGLTRYDDDRCGHLRWKGMYIEVAYDPSFSSSNDRLFWCHKTQKCLGPDGKVADDFECNAARNCFRAL